MAKRGRPRADELEFLVNSIETDYEIADSGGKLLLELIRQERATLRKAEAILAAEGLVKGDRLHPAQLAARDARAAILRALKALHLDIEPLRPKAGRPPGK